MEATHHSRHDDLARTIRDLEDYTRSLRVEVPGSSEMPFSDVLQEVSSLPGEGETHLVVHPEWPWHAAGRGALEKRARDRFGIHDAERTQVIVDIWQDRYRHLLDAAIGSSNRVIEVDDPSSPSGKTVPYPRVSSMAISTEAASGFLEPQQLSNLLLADGLFGHSTDVRVHGAAYACCPTACATQLHAALRFGVYAPSIDPGTTETGFEAITRKLFAYIRQGEILRSSRVRMGVLMECHNYWQRHHPAVEDTAAMTDDATLVVPYQDEASMNARLVS